jgi:hypothetical protein
VVLVERALEDEPAVEQDGYAIGDALQVLDVLRGEDDGAARLAEASGRLPQPPT